jgi:hypothetical protein
MSTFTVVADGGDSAPEIYTDVVDDADDAVSFFRSTKSRGYFVIPVGSERTTHAAGRTPQPLAAAVVYPADRLISVTA